MRAPFFCYNTETSVRISVIIPALDEAAAIGGAIGSASGAFEVLVADGDSADGTAEEARRRGARVVPAGRGRGAQMDEAASVASGDAFVFLHADTRLPAGWRALVEAALSGEGVVGGAFGFAVDRPGARFRALEAAVGLRARRLGLVFGDQAVFARREAFFLAGAYRRLPLMEDVDCVRRLRALGRFVLLDERVVTSGRRWDKRGVLTNIARSTALLALYYAGVPSDRLCSLYYKN